MVEVEAHHRLEEQEERNPEQRREHLVAARPVAGSTGSTPRSSDNLRMQHMGLDHRSIERIAQHSQWDCWLLEHLVSLEERWPLGIERPRRNRSLHHSFPADRLLAGSLRRSRAVGVGFL